MHAAAGVVCGALGFGLTAVLLARDGFDRLAGETGEPTGAGAVMFVESVVLGTIVLTLAGLGIGAILAGVMARSEEQRGASLALAFGVATLGVLGYALLI
jgi:hypothetical protein